MLKSTNVILTWSKPGSFVIIFMRFWQFPVLLISKEELKIQGEQGIMAPRFYNLWTSCHQSLRSCLCVSSVSISHIACAHPGKQRAVVGKHKTSHLVCWLLNRFHWLSQVLPDLLDAFNVYWRKWCLMHFTGKKHIILKQSHYRDHRRGQRHESCDTLSSELVITPVVCEFKNVITPINGILGKWQTL